MDVRKRVRLKLFIMDLIFEAIVNSAIFVIAFFCNRLFETLLFYISWNVYRVSFPKIFHYKGKTPLKSIGGCAISSIFCFYLSIKLMLPISFSIFSGILVGLWLNYVLYILADYRDLRIEKTKNTIDIYKMSEEYLRQYAYKNGLSEMIVDTLILRVKHNYRWHEIAKERNYTKDGIRYHKERLQKILKIKL